MKINTNEVYEKHKEKKFIINKCFRSLRWRLLEYKLLETKNESDKQIIYRKLWDELFSYDSPVNLHD